MDAIHYKVKEDSKIKNKAVYVILGVNKDGFKDILGLWIGESETSKFWYSVLTDLKNRIILEINSYVIELTGRRPIIIPMILMMKKH